MPKTKKTVRKNPSRKKFAPKRAVNYARNKADDKLKIQAHFLNALIETNPDMISVINLKTHKMEFANTKAFIAHGFGSEVKKFRNRNAQARKRAVHPHDRNAIENYFLNFQKMKDEDVQTLEYRATNDRDELNWYLIQGKIFKRNKRGVATYAINVIHNISDQKKAEHDLTKNRELLEATINSSLDRIHVLDAVRNEKGELVDFRFVLMNDAALKMYGNLTGELWRTHYPSVLQEGIFDRFKKVIETGKSVQYEKHYEKDGLDVWTNLSAVKLGDGVVVTAKDIAAIKKVEAEIIENRNLLQTMMDAPNVGVSAFEAIRNNSREIVDFKFDFVNKKTLEAFHGNDPTGKKLSDYGTDGAEQLQYFKEAIETGKKNSYIRKSQSGIVEGWFLFFNAPLGTDRLIQLWEDISELKKAEQQINESKELLQTAINASITSFDICRAIRDQNNQIVDFEFVISNNKFQLPGVDLVGKKYSEAFPGIKATGVFDKFIETTERGTPQDFEVFYQYEGFENWYRLVVVKLGDGFLNTGEDITKRKKAEQEARDRTEELRASRELLQATIDSTLDVIQVFETVRDADNKIVDFTWMMNNKRGILQNGDVIGKRLLSKNPGVIETGIFIKMTQVVETGIPIEHEQFYSYEQFNGWFYQALVKSGDGVVMTSRDITRQKTAEQEIMRLKDEIAKRATDKYYSIFNSIDEGFCIYEVIDDESGKAVDLRWIEVNPAYERQTGLKDPVGKLSSAVTPGTENYWLEIYDSVAKTGIAVQFENWHESTQRWYRVFASRIGAAHNRQVAVVFEDVTERKRMEQRQEFLLKLGNAIRPLANPMEIQSIAMHLLGSHLKVDRVMYADIDLMSEHYVINDNYTTEGVPKIIGRLSFSSFGTATQRLKSGEVFIVNDVSVAEYDEAEKKNFFAIGVYAALAIPLIKSGRLVTVFSVHQASPRVWKDDEIALVQETAEHTWAAVERARAEKTLRVNEERMRVQKEAIQSVVNGASLARSLSMLTDMVVGETNGEARTGFYIIDSDNKHLRTIRGSGNMPESYSEQVDGFPIGFDSLACGLAISTGVPVLTRDVTEEPRWKPCLHLAQQNDFRACWSFPIMTRDNKPVGTFAMYFRNPKEAKSKDSALADIVTQTAAVIISSNVETRQRTYAEEALRKSRQMLSKELEDAELLQQISNRLIGEGDIQALYEALLQSAIDIMHSDMASIQTLNAETNELYLQNHKNFHPESVKIWEYVSIDSTASCALAVANGERVIITDVEKVKMNEKDLQGYRLSGIRAVQSTLLTSRSGKFLGVISTHWKHTHWPGERELNLLDVLARQTADLIERRQGEDELKQFNLRLEQQVAERTSALEESQRELRESNEQLQHSVSQLESFNYIASHDLQEPLRKVKTFASLISEFKLDNERLNSFIKGINNSVTRMSDLIESLLTYSRTAKPNDAFQLTDLNKILEDVKTDFEIIIREKQATIINTELPVINAIPFQMHQLLANLISNSLKFNERKPAILITSSIVSGDEIKFKHGADSKQKFAELTITDNGIGFDNQYSEKIFQVFQRLHSKSEYSGTGIGLSIVERIVKNHNGYIEATSEKGNGAVFKVYLMS